MELICVFYFVTMNILMVHAYSIDMTSCRKCSNHVDVPCSIEEVAYPCIHDEHSGTWPGKPRNPIGRGVRISTEVWAANFTWQTPYDASFSTLNGFLLTLNIGEEFILDLPYRTQGQPRCFFANLSGTNWTTVHNPHMNCQSGVVLYSLIDCLPGITEEMKTPVVWLLFSTQSVMFHFDCVTARAYADISLTLKSSPVPGVGSNFSVYARVKLLEESVLIRILHRRSRETRFHLNIPMILPSTGHNVNQGPLPMTINFTVEGSTVHVKFGPVASNMDYRVCLMRDSGNDRSNCDRQKITQKGKNNTAFENVPPNTYRIYVQREDGSSMFVTKAFNVTVGPVARTTPPIAAPVILMITMAFIMFIAGITTLCFCVMRRRGHCLSLSEKMCSCSTMYHRPPQSTPNNIYRKQCDSVPEILPVYYDESVQFKQAVQDICMYLGKWANCRINVDWTTNISNEPLLAFEEKPLNSILLIVLSSRMWTLLNKESLSSDFQGNKDEKSELFRRILSEKDENMYRKIIVSLLPLKETGRDLKGMFVYRMTKHMPGRNQNQLQINTEDLYAILKLINEETETLQRGWSSYEELLTLLNSIKCVPKSSVNVNQPLVEDTNKELPNFCSNIVALPPVDHEVLPAACHTCGDKSCGMMSQCMSATQKQAETLTWAHHQTECCSTYNQNAGVQFTTSYPMNGIGPGHSYLHGVDMDLDSASMYQDSNVGIREVCQPLCQAGYSEMQPLESSRGNGCNGNIQREWEPPEDDLESVSCSLIGQRQMEIYQNYKSSVMNK